MKKTKRSFRADGVPLLTIWERQMVFCPSTVKNSSKNSCLSFDSVYFSVPYFLFIHIIATQRLIFKRLNSQNTSSKIEYQNKHDISWMGSDIDY